MVYVGGTYSPMRHSYPRFLAACALLACAGLAAVSANPVHAAARPGRYPGATPAVTDQLVDEMLQLLNVDRASAGRAALTLDRHLMTLAADHSRDMAARHYVSHTAPGDRDVFARFTRAGIQFDDAAENIGRIGGRPPKVEIAALNAAMMAEPLDGASHHDNIVDTQLHRVGIGLYIGLDGSMYLTEDFTD